jgi:4'-phosphopantetheinyl transferase
MVPSDIVETGEQPIPPSGKIDRMQLLPNLENDGSSAKSLPSRSQGPVSNRTRLVSEGLEQIKKDEAHLWYGRADSTVDPRLLHRYRKILSEDEREKVDRYHFPEDRHAGLLTRAMVRCLLSRYVAVEPSRWKFRTNRYCRPEIAEPKLSSTLRFSVAHTDAVIVVLISKNRDVGVDVECLPYDGPCLQVADQFFSPIEVSTLRSLRSSERALRFIQYWTLKESFIKARGVGLAAPLDEFSFSIEEAPTKRTEIRLDPSLEDDPERWQFNLDDIGEEYIVATAIERRRDEKIHLVRREVLHTTAPTEPGERVIPAPIDDHSIGLWPGSDGNSSL